jgi:tetratricopeptide (TPR) repeat protein
MIRLVSALLLAAIVSLPLPTWWRESNSQASTKRGIRQFAAKDYEGASRSLRSAAELAPGSRSAFNAGTAEIATGRTKEAAGALSKAAEDPAIAPDVFYNRGTGELNAKQYDEAVNDLIAALKLRPNDANAKRNLEIALQRKEQQQQQQRGGGQQSRTNPQGQQDQQPRAQQQPQASGMPDVEQLLRSVQEQEREELSRMRREHAAGSQKVGW